MRTAALEEVLLAVRVLINGQHFTSGVAAALCAHIQQTLRGTERLLNTDIYLEHAQFLPLQSLLELLDFLWLQIGLRFPFLPLVENVRQRLLEVSIPMSVVVSHITLLGQCRGGAQSLHIVIRYRVLWQNTALLARGRTHIGVTALLAV